MKFLIWLYRECTSLTELVSALKKDGNEVGILLLQDGVFLADKGCEYASEIAGFNVPVYAAKPHVEERGISNRFAVNVTLVDYPEIIDLMMEKYDRIISV